MQTSFYSFCLLILGLTGGLVSSLSANLSSLDTDKEQRQEAYSDSKTLIAKLQESLKEATVDKHCDIQLQLTKAYFRDQDREKAFQAFLKALDLTKEETTPSVSEAERELYEEALKIYLEHPSANARIGAEKILKDFGDQQATHSDYYLLGFIISAAYANLNQFETFFEKFYQSYRYFSKHYMAYKIKTILHSQLFMRAQTPPAQEIHRLAIIENAGLAIQQNPYDTTLYRMLISFAPEANKEQSIEACLNKIIDMNIIIPRADIAFFVQQAVAHKQSELAQRFLNKEKQWFPQSRVIDSAQQYLDEQLRSQHG